ncbi:MAG: hypothetical protein ACPGU5_02305 [Lishizhenia sp.]
MKVSVLVGVLLFSVGSFAQEKSEIETSNPSKEQKIESTPIHKSEGKLIIKKRTPASASARKPEQKVALEPKKQKLQKK